MKTDDVAPIVDATSTGDGDQEEGDSTSINSFDADVEGIRRNLEEKLAGAESTVGNNTTTTAESKGADDAMCTNSTGSTTTPPTEKQSTGTSTNQATGGIQSPGAAGPATGSPHNAAAPSATNNAANSAWTPRDATSSSNKNKNKNRKSASFSSQTKFNQKTPGSSVPRKRANTSEPEVEVVVKHQFIARVLMKLPKCNSVQQMALTLLDDGLKILQTRNPSACYIKPGHNPTVSARSLAELPREFVDFYDDWSKWEDPISM